MFTTARRLFVALLVFHYLDLIAATFTVTNVGDTGPGTLRQAIFQANTNAGLDTIAFNIPGTGVKTIAPASNLPSLVDPVIIDGFTQPGTHRNTLAQGDNAVLLIELDGLGITSVGLDVETENSIIRGLIVHRFETGMYLGQGASNLIAGNFVGTDSSGTLGLGNILGITLTGSFAKIGGTAPEARNLISGNQWIGLNIPSTDLPDNLVQGNYIGTDASGRRALGNQWGMSLGGGLNLT